MPSESRVAIRCMPHPLPSKVTSADVRQFDRIIHATAKKWIPALGRFHTFDDLVAIGRAVTWASLTRWDPNGGASKLTYVMRMLKFAMIAELKFWNCGNRVGMRRETDIDATFDGSGHPHFQFAADQPDPDEELDRKRAARRPPEDSIAASMARLSLREQRVLRLRSEGKTLGEIGDEFGVSRERIRQIEQLAIKRIRLDILGEA